MGTSSDRGGAAATPRARREEKRKQAAPATRREPTGEDEAKPIAPSLFAALFELVDHFAAAALDGGVSFVILAALRALLVMVDRWGTPEAEQIYHVALQLGRVESVPRVQPLADAPPSGATAARQPATVGDLYSAALRASVGASGRELYDEEGLASTSGDLLVCALGGRGFDDRNLDVLQAVLDDLGDVLGESDLNVTGVYWKLDRISIKLRILEILHLRVLDTPLQGSLNAKDVHVAAHRATEARLEVQNVVEQVASLSRAIDAATAPPAKRAGTTPSERRAARLDLQRCAQVCVTDAKDSLEAVDKYLAQLECPPARAAAEVKP